MKTQDWLIIGAAAFLIYPKVKEILGGVEATTQTVGSVLDVFDNVMETPNAIGSAVGDAYTSIDQNYFGGVLPGGSELQTPATTSGGTTTGSYLHPDYSGYGHGLLQNPRGVKTRIAEAQIRMEEMIAKLNGGSGNTSGGGAR